MSATSAVNILASQSEHWMPLEQLEKTRPFQMLSPKMQLWVSTYVSHALENGILDPLLATKMSYDVSEESAKTFSYQILGNLKVVAVLNIFFGKNPAQVFLDHVERAIRKGNLTVSQVDVLKLYAAVLGIESGIPRYGKPVKAKAKKSSGLFLPPDAPAELVASADGKPDLHSVDGGKTWTR